MSDWQEARERAEVYHKSRFFGIQTPEQALTLMMIGRDLGIPETQALRAVNVIEGKPSIPPELMLGLCLRKIPGFTYEFGHCDHTTATVTVSRPGLAKPFVSLFTMADAQRAGLVKPRSAWEKYPANMLRWRALANALHIVAPDVIVGVYTPEELGAEVNASGEAVKTNGVSHPVAPQACADCHGPIIDGLVAGSPMTAQQIVEATFASFGRQLCIACADATAAASAAAATTETPDATGNPLDDPNYDPWDGPNDENPNNPKPA